ncbi:MAG: BatA domain-containing protein [Candidatus Hydrothermales bacterium]
MIFLKPLFLLALPLALIPVIIHLIFPHKKLKLFYPWTEIFEREKEIKKRKRLKDTLILVTRVLAIFFIILSFSEPTIKSKYGHFNHLIYFEHPFWTRKLKNFNVKKIPFSKFDSLTSDNSLKSLFILGPIPDTFKEKILDIDKKIYVIGSQEIKNLKITDIKKISEEIIITVQSDFDTKSIPIEIFHEKNLILREEKNIVRGKNTFRYKISDKLNPLLIRLDIKDGYPDDNERFFYNEKEKGVNFEIYGKNKFITALSEVIKKGEDKIYLVTDLKNFKNIEKLTERKRYFILFPDTLTEELKLLLTKKGFKINGYLNNAYSNDGKLNFRKILLISGEKNFKTDNFNYNIFSICENIALASFYPSEENTNFIYFPDFVRLFIEVIQFFLSNKIVIHESTVIELNLKEKFFSLYNYKGEKIYDLKTEKNFILKPLTRGIYFLKNEKEIIIEVNPKILPNILKLENIKPNLIFIKNESELYSINLRKTLLLLSFIMITFEIILCLL